jgi:hypothetical protein
MASATDSRDVHSILAATQAWCLPGGVRPNRLGRVFLDLSGCFTIHDEEVE